MKDTFSRHGIPDEVVSDNGSQYKSYLFRKFVKEWGFKHTTSSPYYPRSNGLSKSSVKTVKYMIKKCLDSNQDIKEGLMAIRNTPLPCKSSPAELIYGRPLQERLPRLPQAPAPVQRDLIQERTTQKEYHDAKIQKNKVIEPFHPGQRVALQDQNTKEWTIRGTILTKVAPRAFLIKTTNGTTLRRNIQHIKKLHSTSSFMIQDKHNDNDNEAILYDQNNEDIMSNKGEEEQSDSDTIPYDEDDIMGEVEEEMKEVYTTKSGRCTRRKAPTDYEDL